MFVCLICLRKVLSTCLTLVWFFASVNSHMYTKIYFLICRIWTRFAKPIPVHSFHLCGYRFLQELRYCKIYFQTETKFIRILIHFLYIIFCGKIRRVRVAPVYFLFFILFSFFFILRFLLHFPLPFFRFFSYFVLFHFYSIFYICRFFLIFFCFHFSFLFSFFV